MNRYIMIEGPDGVGKTSVCNHLYSCLTDLGYNVVRVFEPGTTKIGHALRRILLSSELDDMTRMLLMFGARSDLMEQVVKPALKTPNTIVLADRGAPSTYAYQCNTQQMRELYHSMADMIVPRHTMVLLRAQFETSMARMEDRNKPADVLDCEDRQRFMSLMLAYEQLNPDFVVDTDNRTALAVAQYIIAGLDL